MALEAGLSDREALEACYENSRDNARTPMQWDDSANAGFSSGTPWLKVNPNYKDINVKEQSGRPDSVLNYYKKLLALRKNDSYREVLTYGACIPMYLDEDNIFAYAREKDNHKVIVLANFSDKPRVLNGDFANRPILLNNMENITLSPSSVTLMPCQAVVFGEI